MPPQEFLTADIHHPHYRRILSAALMAIVVFGLALWGYIVIKPEKTIEVLEVMMPRNTPVALSPEEIQLRESLKDRDNKPIQLNTEEIQARNTLSN